jgi:hypothetical protein
MMPNDSATSENVKSIPSVPLVTLPPTLKVNWSAPLIVTIRESSNVSLTASFVQIVESIPVSFIS